MNRKILFVDDDINILRGFQRRLQGGYDLQMAQSGDGGLTQLQVNGPFAAVVADMRMPQMDGIEFLSAVKKQAPNTVRMMLTGNADMQTAIDAVNHGSIFRFLMKPCPKDILISSLDAALDQYRLVTAERELLEKTLGGSIKLLIELLSSTIPEVFSQANRVARRVGEIATFLQLPNVWQFKSAAMFSQIGCVTLPPEILEKLKAKALLTESEREIFAGHPTVGRQLLAHIPRFELMAHMIEGQNQPGGTAINPYEQMSEETLIKFGAQLLKLAWDFDQEFTESGSNSEALTLLQSRPNAYNPYLLDALQQMVAATASEETESKIIELSVDELEVGMVVNEDVESKSGMLLLHEGHEVTLSVLLRLRNFARGSGVVEPVYVRTFE